MAPLLKMIEGDFAYEIETQRINPPPLKTLSIIALLERI